EVSFVYRARKDSRGRSFRRRYRCEQRKDGRRQTGDAVADELFERRGERQWPGGGGGGVGEFEREHRVAAGGLVHARHRRPRDVQTETRSHQMVERADAQRSDADLGDALLESVAEVEWVARVAALRDENPDLSVAKPSRREGGDPLGGRAEPLAAAAA